VVSSTLVANRRPITGFRDSRRTFMAARYGLNGIVCAALAGAVTLFVGHAALAGEQPSEAQILDALKPKISRSMSNAPADPARAAEEQKAIETLRLGQRTRSLSSSQREQVAAVAKEKPKVDLEIYFDYNSATISAEAIPTLDKLGHVLSNPDLQGSIFMIAGHTDAKGGENYNLGLSERRAEAVKRYLVEKFNLSAESLTSIGYGKEQLKDKDNPFAPENRRVQVVNMQSKSTAEAK
jgi:outer membrane protein OmpA-like peptidoglycan-associated protein